MLPKPSLTRLLIAALCTLIVTYSLYIYVTSNTHADTAFCADCMHYAMSVEARIVSAGNVRGNAQFFRYALDTSCRGVLFTSKRCVGFRRGFLDDVGRYMYAVERPYEACKGIGACG